MAAKKNAKLPEDVAASFKLVGSQRKYITKPIPELGRVTVDVESLTPDMAEKIVDHVPFLKRYTPKAKTKKW